MRLSPAVILLAAACTQSPGGPSVQQTGPDEFAIPYGQALVLPGTVFEVRFQALLGDSRCPKDVVCVWEGEGRVELGLTMGDGPTTPVELNTRGPVTVTYAGYVVTMLALDPYPVSTESHPAEDYVVRLRIVPGARDPS
jgi:hypothetical protein